MLAFKGFRSAILLGLALLLLGMVFVGTSSTEETDRDLDISSIDLSKVKENAIRDLYDSSGNMINPHRQMHAVSKAHAGGFGGFYFSDDDPSTVYVYMTDPTSVAEAETAFRAARGESSQYTNIVPVQGRYTMDQVVEWAYTALAALEGAGVVVSTFGVSIMDNAFKITVVETDYIDDAWRIMDGLGIPRGAVLMGVGIVELLADKDNVRGKWRPVV